MNPANRHSGEIEFINTKNGDTQHARFFILFGRVPNAGTGGTIHVQHHLKSFPSQKFPVNGDYFKAFVHLDPGENRLDIEYWNNQVLVQASTLVQHYEPLMQNRPIHMVYLLGKDSDGSFDSPEYKKSKEGNNVDAAVKKLRMAGYMMSAFTSKNMRRTGFGTRTFRFEEEWGPDSSTNQDEISRHRIKVHVVRSNYTVAQIRDANISQQNPDAKDKEKLFAIASETLKAQGFPFLSGEHSWTQAAVIFADTHWDKDRKLVLGHAALGGGFNDFKVAIFGSHAIFSWPKSVEEIVPCFLDQFGVNNNEVADDSGPHGTSWESLNTSMGAFLHEIGHSLGCPHQVSGIMRHEFTVWNRSFMTSEAFVRNQDRPGLKLCLPETECTWHRMDMVRFRYHESFRLPNEYRGERLHPTLYPVRDGYLVGEGVYLVEITHGTEDAQTIAFIELLNTKARRTVLTYDHIVREAPQEHRNKNLIVRFVSSGGTLNLSNFQAKVQEHTVLDDNEWKSRSESMHKSVLVGTAKNAHWIRFFPDSKIKMIVVNNGLYIEGMAIYFENGTVISVGGQGGHSDTFHFLPNEILRGFRITSHNYVDTMEIVTERRTSPRYGHFWNGSSVFITPPKGYSLIGLHGHAQNWLMALGLIYAKVRFF